MSFGGVCVGQIFFLSVNIISEIFFSSKFKNPFFYFILKMVSIEIFIQNDQIKSNLVDVGCCPTVSS